MAPERGLAAGSSPRSVTNIDFDIDSVAGGHTLAGEVPRRLDMIDLTPDRPTLGKAVSPSDPKPDTGRSSKAHDADQPVAHAAPDQEDASTAAWFDRPWRERVQAADVAIGGLVLVIGLVSGLVLLGGSSQAPGTRPLAAGALGSTWTKGSHSSRSGTRVPTAQKAQGLAAPTGSSSAGSSASVSADATAAGSAKQPGTNRAGATGTAPGRTPVTAPAPARAPPPLCTPGDVTISTTTDSSSYPVGAAVTIRTQLVDNAPCVFDPVASGAYSCPTTVVVSNPAGVQTYPEPGQGEQCAGVSPGTLTPGATVTVTVVWNQQGSVGGNPVPPPAGQYTATGTWSWGDQSSPYQASANSAPFTIAP